MNNIDFTKRFSKVFVEIKVPINVYITGSRAVSEEREGKYASDIDILIITHDIKGAKNVREEIDQIYHSDLNLPQASYIFAISQTICNNFYSGLVRRTNFSEPIRCDYDLDVRKEYSLFQLVNSSLQCVMYYLSKYYHNKLSVSCYKSLRAMFETEFLLMNMRFPIGLQELLTYIKKMNLNEYIQFNKYVHGFYNGIECDDNDLYEFTLIKLGSLLSKIQDCGLELYYDSLRYVLTSYHIEAVLEKLYDFSKVFSMV